MDDGMSLSRYLSFERGSDSRAVAKGIVKAGLDVVHR
jgi:hypothetical protein